MRLVVIFVYVNVCGLLFFLVCSFSRDHAGGNQKMSELVSGLNIFGGDERISALTQKVVHGDSLKVGNLDVQCLFTPCHTTGHICYFVKDAHETHSPVVFTGTF